MRGALRFPVNLEERTVSVVSPHCLVAALELQVGRVLSGVSHSFSEA